MMIRLAGAGAIAVSGLIWGLYKSETYRCRTVQCMKMMQMIQRIMDYIRYDGLDVYDIVRELRTYVEFSDFVVDVDIESDFNVSACENVEKHFVNGEERNILLELWGQLGSTDSEGQLNKLSGLYERLSRLYEQRTEEYGKYGRLYRSVGLLLGLMAGIAVI